MAERPFEEKVAVLEEKVRQLELVERAIRLEVHDSRIEMQASLRQSYLTAAEMRNVFVTRDELQRQAVNRREWWPIVLGIIVTGATITNLIIALRGGR